MQTLTKQKLSKFALCTAVALLWATAWAQTGLTTVQDTLFRADGTRFSGTLVVHWNTFDASGIGTIVQQSRSVPVQNGNLQLQLAPNAGSPSPTNIYTVQYESDGLEQFTEVWTVFPSSVPVKVADVRTGVVTSSTPAPGNSTPILESSVVGLTADLAQRPVKGAGFGAGSVAVINQNGQIETVVGNVGDCVFADGSTGPCGSGSSATFFDAETPGGLVDGVNATFTLANAPGSSLMLFRNGMYMKAAFDYTLTGSTLQFVTGAVPQPGDTLVASYRLDQAPSIGNLSSPPAGSSTLAQVLCSSNGRANTHTAFVSLGSCDIPAAILRPGDRIEVQFTFTHTGTASGFDMQINWGNTTVLARHGGTQDTALAGRAEASLSTAGALITLQSWGTVLPFLPGILGAPLQNGVQLDLRGSVSHEGNDAVALSGFTVLRYPGN